MGCYLYNYSSVSLPGGRDPSRFWQHRRRRYFSRARRRRRFALRPLDVGGDARRRASSWAAAAAAASSGRHGGTMSRRRGHAEASLRSSNTRAGATGGRLCGDASSPGGRGAGRGRGVPPSPCPPPAAPLCSGRKSPDQSAESATRAAGDSCHDGVPCRRRRGDSPSLTRSDAGGAFSVSPPLSFSPWRG